MQRIIIVAAVVVSAFAACGGDDDDVPQGSPTASAPGSSQAAAQVTRQVLQSGFSDAAPGQKLELTRVVIPPDKDIAPHAHPGPQLALIVEGTLSYTVISGEVRVMRSGFDTAETIEAGQTSEIQPGDSLAEPVGVVHTARNPGPDPVVILISALFPEGAPASSPAPVSPTPAGESSY
jgi:quercetin dioxygenase-like cupin family protein